MEKLIIISLIIGLVLPGIAFTQENKPLLQPPNTLKEAKIIVFKVLGPIWETLKKIGQGILEVLKKIWDWIRSIWNFYIFPFFQNIWQKIQSFFGKEVGKEVERRKEIIKEEFPKEKEEIKEEGKSLWQRFKELIR